VFPLTKGDETIGALALYASDLEAYSGDQLHLLESVSRLASTALQHAILHEQTRAIAQTDVLTGLPNGRALYARFDQELAHASENNSSLLCLNIEGLRAIIDSYGYQAGDRVLAGVAAKLWETLGDAGMLSRIAGDEFIYLLQGCTESDAARLGAQAQFEVCSFLHEVRPEQHARVGLSYGVAEFPADGRSIDDLLHAAALATRQNKAALVEDPVVSMPKNYSRKTGPLALVG
jgi:diguanylate cyclase (GGDEF)-like protein